MEAATTPRQHELRVMGGKGDTKIIWNPDNTDEVANARRSFDDMTGKGFRAFAVARAGAKGDRVHEFDPEAEKLIIVPPMAGG
jgi:hypothetical protein